MSPTNVAHADKRGNICVGNNVSATICPRFPGPLASNCIKLHIVWIFAYVLCDYSHCNCQCQIFRNRFRFFFSLYFRKINYQLSFSFSWGDRVGVGGGGAALCRNFLRTLYLNLPDLPQISSFPSVYYISMFSMSHPSQHSHFCFCLELFCLGAFSRKRAHLIWLQTVTNVHRRHLQVEDFKTRSCDGGWS